MITRYIDHSLCKNDYCNLYDVKNDPTARALHPGIEGNLSI